MKYDSQIRRLREAAAAALEPPPEIDLSEWSEREVRLSPEDSATRGQFTAWPFQREPMTVMSPSHPCEKVVLKCASQTMKTRLILNFIGYVIAVDPGPALAIEPTQDDAESLSKDRLEPMLRDMPALKGKIREAKSRDSGNTIFHKKFTGGHLTVAYATAPSKLAMRPIRYLLFDEVSRYNRSAGKEGDPVRLGEKRTVQFWNRKIIYASSPGNDGECRISSVYEFSDQREWFVPCPFCGHEQVIQWSGIRWGSVDARRKTDGNAYEDYVAEIPVEDPHYQCVSCRCLIPHHLKANMVDRGRWIPQNPDGKYPGFHISQLVSLSPNCSWAKIVEEWLQIQGKPEEMKVFVNTVLGETWKETGEAPDWEKLKARVEDFEPGTAPAGVLFIAAGVDVQADRVVVDFWGWGRGRQRWFLDRAVLPGDPARPEVWAALDAELARTFRHSSGVDLAVLKVAIDSGHAATEVYQWARRQGSARVLVVKGYSSGVALLGQPTAADINRKGKRVKAGVRVWPVNVSMAKAELYGSLRQSRPEDGNSFPPGWIHYHRDTEDEWFRELCAEQYVTRVVKGYRKGEWVKTRERNEALDCANYARAAASSVGIDRFAEHNWRALEAYLRTAEVEPDPPEQAEPEQPEPESGDGDGVIRPVVAPPAVRQVRKTGRRIIGRF